MRSPSLILPLIASPPHSLFILGVFLFFYSFYGKGSLRQEKEIDG